VDFTAIAQFKTRVGAGATASANGDLAQDSSTGYWHAYVNVHDRLFIGAANIGASGQVAESNADSTATFADPIVSGPDATGATLLGGVNYNVLGLYGANSNWNLLNSRGAIFARGDFLPRPLPSAPRASDLPALTSWFARRRIPAARSPRAPTGWWPPTKTPRRVLWKGR
jgi:hypothetical protein